MKKITLSALCVLALGTLSAVSGRAELVTDGTFSGGFTSWNIPAGATSGDPYYMSTSSLGAQFGTYYDDSTPANPLTGSVSQTLATTPGQQYTITFLYGEYNSNQSVGNPSSNACCYLDPGHLTSSNDPSANPWAQSNSLSVLFGGADVLDVSNFFTSDPANAGPNNTDGGTSIGDYFYQGASVTVVATGTSTTLEFDARDYQQGLLLDDVSAVESPEPSTWMLFGTGIALIAYFRMRNRKAVLQ